MKRLKRRHKEFLTKEGIDYHQFLLIGELAECYKFYYRRTGRVIYIRR